VPIQLADTPIAPLYRIGHAPDPFAFPPRAFLGGGRYDHPDAEFITLYAAEQRRGAFMETLEAFRPSIADLAVARALSPGDADDVAPMAGVIPTSYFRKMLIHLHVPAGGWWLDHRVPATHQALRGLLAHELDPLGYRGRFVWGDLLSHDHRLTQAIAIWAYDEEFDGIVYRSCHDAALDCWALFDRARFSQFGSPLKIARDDPDLLSVAELFGLTLPESAIPARD
jgi:hypothetical protein